MGHMATKKTRSRARRSKPAAPKKPSAPPKAATPPKEAAPPPTAAPPKPPATKVAPTVSAIEMGARQREISVSEFFTKNRHLLGFDSPRKALLTCVKEAVDNALDACEEGGILPDVLVKLEVVGDGVPDHGRRQRAWDRPPADPEDLRQAPLRIQVPPPPDEPRAAGDRDFGRGDVRPAHDGEAGPDHLPHRPESCRALFRSPDRREEERAPRPREQEDRMGP